MRRAPSAKGEMFVINLSGRGDKDTDIYRENLKELDEPGSDMTRISRLFERLRPAKRPALIAYITAGDPSPAAHARTGGCAGTRRRGSD